VEMKMKVVYEIKEGESWRGSEGLDIKSNIADDKMVDCRLAKTLVEYLKKEAVALEPDKMLLRIAEAQKREIELNLEALDDMALQSKSRAAKVQEKILERGIESEQKYEEFSKKFKDISQKFRSEVDSTSESLKKDMEKVENLSKKLSEIDNYGLENLSKTLEKIIALASEDSELLKIVLDYKKN